MTAFIVVFLYGMSSPRFFDCEIIESLTSNKKKKEKKVGETREAKITSLTQLLLQHQHNKYIPSYRQVCEISIVG